MMLFNTGTTTKKTFSHKHFGESHTLKNSETYNTNIGFSNIMPIFMACDKSISSRAAFDYYYWRKFNLLLWIFRIRKPLARTNIMFLLEKCSSGFSIFSNPRNQKICETNQRKLVAEWTFSPKRRLNTEYRKLEATTRRRSTKRFFSLSLRIFLFMWKFQGRSYSVFSLWLACLSNKL